VDGNMRLAGARLLGNHCPPLKCEVVDATRAEQLLAMAVTNAFHYPKDPIGEARHYRRLVREEGYSVGEIARHTGLHARTIESRLRLLDLDEEVQELIAAGGLPRDRRVADALLSVGDVQARVKLARRLARPGITVKAIQAACARLVEQLETQSAGRSDVPMLALARNGGGSPGGSTTFTWETVRQAAGEMCAACEATANELQGVPGPAWAFIAHEAGQVCDECNLKGITVVCRECPGVELLSRLVAVAREVIAARLAEEIDRGELPSRNGGGNGQRSSGG
jgi:ParB-like chromosome segregation protein Spo0J